MKYSTQFNFAAKSIALTSLLTAGITAMVIAAPADLSKSPLATSSSTSIKSNLVFILDDSGSMAWDFMPDQIMYNASNNLLQHCRSAGPSGSGASFSPGTFAADCCKDSSLNDACYGINGHSSRRMLPPLLASDFNGVAYNPNIRYSPPLKYDGSSYPSMDSAQTSGWTNVKNDGFGVQSTGDTDLTTEFPDMIWCPSSSSPDSDCVRDKNYVLPGKIGAVTYNVKRAKFATGTAQKFAKGTPDNISTETRNVGPHYYKIVTGEYCSSIDLRDCAIQAGPTADKSYPAPVRWCKTESAAAKLTPTTGDCRAVRTADFPYARYPGRYGAAGNFPGSFERVDIVTTTSSYPKSVARTDCAGATCTYAEEMTNFANWWAYYRTRMQLMKTASSRAFQPVGNNYRLGYFTLNRNATGDFLNLDTFESTHKSNWYSQLFAAKPSSGTPLRQALSVAGRLYAGRLNGTSIDGVTVKEPMEYSCQKNFALLSTDGYWNGSAGVKVDGSSAIGELDSSLTAPKKDGVPQSNSLADTAYYYFSTDLRHDDGSAAATAYCKNSSNGQDLCGNSSNPAKVPHEKQNMQLFSLGLGLPGNMQYIPNYLSANTGDYHAIKQELAADPGNGICSWQSSGTCTWPKPEADKPSAIDDLWHAAVNTDGLYFSAKDPDSLFAGLRSALIAIDKKAGASAAATTSNPNVTAGDNQIFVSNYVTGEWSGDVKSHRIDVNTGDVDTANSDWSAKAWLDANAASRTIYMFSSAAANKLKSFSWASLSGTEQAYFSTPYISSGANPLSQFCVSGPYCLSTTDQAAASGAALVNFLKGDRSNEGQLTEVNKYFRARASVLGDVVHSEGVYVKTSRRGYTDTGYTAHRAAMLSRAGMLYFGANDGALHALDAATGAERWAFIPTAVLPKLYTLADKEYATKHEYFVNATPVIADIKIGSNWRTILVSGLGQGGRSYFALDITDPLNPKALWEFTHNNLGYTLGKAEIGKLADGTWTVFLPSGYNNVSPGDGKGYVFAVDAATGNLITSATVSTNSGSVSTPSNLGHIRAWMDDGFSDATVARLYGGDTDGNVWRFDVNNNVGAPGVEAQLLATLKNDANVVQPVTSRPELGLVNKTHVMVYVGTGRYLGVSDIPDTQIGSIYGIKDRLTDQSYGNPRSAMTLPAFVKQTLGTTTACPPGSEGLCSPGDLMRTTINPLPVDLAVKGGWYVDLLVSGERVHTDMRLVRGTLAVNSGIPDTSGACKAGGTGWINYIDYATGATVGAFLGNAIPTAPTITLVGSDLWDFTVMPGGGGGGPGGKCPGGICKTPPPNDDAPTPARRLRWRNLLTD
ncbi:pilus assembly protein [Inhella proteolytica]|uniref:PQQ-binding-like beta-propeller repeat protein n=1 Tax=Inhella proteolytica TaxID=2795029 RepID=A0A931IYB3_9BURK|nr:PilC/PilY family type IV pilus protein [Inhella proteolytica]MBH9576006.1 PQQ-binding-like beta-propeller repeat protein [Inhella proteolytica]